MKPNHLHAMQSSSHCRKGVPTTRLFTTAGTRLRSSTAHTYSPATRSSSIPCSSLTPQHHTATSRRRAVVAAARPVSAPALQYSADVSAEEWSHRPVPVAARLLEIAAAFGSWWVKSLWHKDPQRAAAGMREVLVELGPAFVKIGQALSSRPDVLPPEYITELELLQVRYVHSQRR